MVRPGAYRLFYSRFSWARAKLSALTKGGTGISIHSVRGRSWFALLRIAKPPRKRSGRVMRWRGANKGMEGLTTMPDGTTLVDFEQQP
jgi:hypothetical protein